MAIALTCPCGARLKLPDENANQWVSCPRCDVIVNLPPDEPDRQQRKGKTRARRQYLRAVDRALLVYYVAPFVFLLGVGSGLLAVIFDLNGELYDWESALATANGLFKISGPFLFFAGLLAFSAAMMGLVGSAPHTGGQRALMGGMGLLAVGCLCAALLAVLPEFRSTLFFAALTILLVGWWCWMAFLGQLGPVLKSTVLDDGAEQALWSVLRTVAILVPLLLFEGVMIGFTVKRPWLIPFAHAPFIAAVAAISYRVGEFESILSLFFAPTGVPFALDYLNFIAGVRGLVQRRL
jgi:hypothetical protein